VYNSADTLLKVPVHFAQRQSS